MSITIVQTGSASSDAFLYSKNRLHASLSGFNKYFLISQCD